MRKIVEYLISTILLSILSYIPLNYIWGTFNSYLYLISGAGFGIFLITPLSYILLIAKWIYTKKVFFKLPSLITLAWIKFKKKHCASGKYLYLFIMTFCLLYLLYFFSYKTCFMYCSGWLISIFFAFFCTNNIAILFNAIWLNHAIGTIIHDYFIMHQSNSFYQLLTPIMYYERLTLFLFALGVYKLLENFYKSYLMTWLENKIFLKLCSIVSFFKRK